MAVKSLAAEGWGDDWEPVIESPPGGRRAARVSLWRVKVPGGWLCRTVEIRHFTGVSEPVVAVALGFVPDPRSPPEPDEPTRP
jgi:hypothetical protein